MELQHLPVPLLSSILSPSHTIVWSPHSYISSCWWSLHFSCGAAEGVTEGCTLRVLLLTLQSKEKYIHELYVTTRMAALNFYGQLSDWANFGCIFRGHR